MGNKYRLGRKIGSGSFGDIYLGECESLSQGGFLNCIIVLGLFFLPVGICGHHVRLEGVEKRKNYWNTASGFWPFHGKERGMSSALLYHILKTQWWLIRLF